MAIQGVTKQFERRQRVKGSRRQYTFSGNYKNEKKEEHEGDYLIYKHYDHCDKLIERWRECRGKNMFLCEPDIAHYNKRLALYDTLKEKLETLDPLKDYAEIAAAQYKIKAIREEFYDLSRRNKQTE